MLAHDIEHALDLISWIDDHGLARALVADHRAIALQQTNRKNLMDHVSSLVGVHGKLEIGTLRTAVQMG